MYSQESRGRSRGRRSRSHDPFVRRRRPGSPFLRWAAAGAILLAIGLGWAWLRQSPWVLRQLYPFGYRAQIISHAQSQGLDPIFVAALIKAESNFWPWARSRKDARGLMQMTPETGRWVAAQTAHAGFEADALYDPEVNLDLGCWYLAYLLAEYRGNLPATLAAWNGGRTNVDLWLGNGTWSGKLDDAGRIPFHETRDFVRRVLDNMAWYEKLYGGQID